MVVIKLRNSVQPAPPDRYASLQEFFDDMSDYGEIIFEHLGTKYIVSYYDNKLSIAVSNKPETEKIFESLTAFAESFLIGGECFKDFVSKINILVR